MGEDSTVRAETLFCAPSRPRIDGEREHCPGDRCGHGGDRADQAQQRPAPVWTVAGIVVEAFTALLPVIGRTTTAMTTSPVSSISGRWTRVGADRNAPLNCRS